MIFTPWLTYNVCLIAQVIHSCMYAVCELQYTKFKTQLKLTFWAREPNSKLGRNKSALFLKTASTIWSVAHSGSRIGGRRGNLKFKVINWYYYSFKIFCHFWLAPIPQLILHNHVALGIWKMQQCTMYHWFNGIFAKKQGCLGNSEPKKGDLSYPKTKIVAKFLIKTIEEAQEYAKVYGILVKLQNSSHHTQPYSNDNLLLIINYTKPNKKLMDLNYCIKEYDSPLRKQLHCISDETKNLSVSFSSALKTLRFCQNKMN